MEQKIFCTFLYFSQDIQVFLQTYLLNIFFVVDKMIIIVWAVLKNYRNFTFMCSCIITMTSTFRGFFQMEHTFTSWCNFSSSFVGKNIFFFSKSIIFFACFLKFWQRFFIKSLPRYKVGLFYMWSSAQTVDIEYLQGICSPIFVLHIHLFFKLKIQCQYK